MSLSIIAKIVDEIDYEGIKKYIQAQSIEIYTDLKDEFIKD